MLLRYFNKKSLKVFKKYIIFSGVIEFDHISMKYDEDSKLVLRDICFKTQICEKIGIVGRTGAGKSSLITAIFRLTEPSGTIWIDQQNICKMVSRLCLLHTKLVYLLYNNKKSPFFRDFMT